MTVIYILLIIYIIIGIFFAMIAVAPNIESHRRHAPTNDLFYLKLGLVLLFFWLPFLLIVIYQIHFKRKIMRLFGVEENYIGD